MIYLFNSACIIIQRYLSNISTIIQNESALILLAVYTEDVELFKLSKVHENILIKIIGNYIMYYGNRIKPILIALIFSMDNINGSDFHWTYIILDWSSLSSSRSIARNSTIFGIWITNTDLVNYVKYAFIPYSTYLTVHEYLRVLFIGKWKWS